jgi:hypothetical protein
MAKLNYDRNSKSGQYVSLGRASDGVIILKPAAKPKHFTQDQIERTVDRVRGDAGRFMESSRHRGSAKGAAGSVLSQEPSKAPKSR